MSNNTDPLRKLADEIADEHLDLEERLKALEAKAAKPDDPILALARRIGEAQADAEEALEREVATLRNAMDAQANELNRRLLATDRYALELERRLSALEAGRPG